MEDRYMSEASIAKKIGAILVKNSGRGLRKGDMTWEDFVIDAKEGKSFAFNERAWAKICDDALSHGVDREPMILRVFPSGGMVACIPWNYFEYLFLEVQSLREELGELH